jgi:menaquinone-9 beta-reductase
MRFLGAMIDPGSDPLIIGAGPAGAAAAIMLARGGAKPLMLEAQPETGDAICGGFLSWQTVRQLEALGLDAATLGGASVSLMRLFSGKRIAQIPLPAPAIGLSRKRLDLLLQAKAVAQGAGLAMGVSVRALEDDGTVLLADGAALAPESLFLATGKHDLRGLGRPREGAATLGLRVRMSPNPALSALIGPSIELHLFAGGYVGLVLQEDGSANLCLAVRKERLASAGGQPMALLRSLERECPTLGERLAFMDQEQTVDAIAAVPYGYICAETVPGRFRLGDQAACIPSLAGEGIGLALASGTRAASAWLKRGPMVAPDYQQDFARAAARPVRTAGLIWHVAESPALAPLMVTAAQVLPSLARVAARWTRITP